jgi:hypothetical protein
MESKKEDLSEIRPSVQKGVKLSLVQAQKCVDKLRSSLKTQSSHGRNWMMQQTQFEPPATFGFLNFVRQYSPSDNVKIADAFKSIATQNYQIINGHTAVNNDIKLLKTAIYNENARIGLSNILTKIEIFNDEKSLFMKIKKLLESDGIINLDSLQMNYDRYKTNTEDRSLPSSISIISLQEVNNLLTNLNKLIAEEEQKRDKLNANNEITFTFSDYSSNILGR